MNKGKAEIDNAANVLIKMKVGEWKIKTFHANLDQEVKTSLVSDHRRNDKPIILPTSCTEASIMVADVEFVIDSGIS